MSSKTYRWCLFVLILGGTLARVGLIAKDYGKVDDPDNYLPLARTLWTTHRFAIDGRLSAYRPPLFPIVLVPVIAALPERIPLGLAILQVGLGGLTILFTAEAARRWTGSLAGSLLTAAIVAFDPVLVSQCRSVMTETLAAFLTAMTLLAFTKPGLRGSALGGVAFGLSALCRPSVWPAIGLSFAAILLLSNETKRSRLRNALVMMAGCLVVVSPWIVRNAVVFGEPIATTTHGGYTLFLANNSIYYDEILNGRPGMVWSGGNQLTWWRSVNRDTKGMPEPEADRFARRSALEFIASRPLDFVRASVARLSRFWGLAPAESVYPRWLRIISTIWTFPLWIALALGLSRRELWRWPMASAPALLIGLSFVHTFFWTDLRMRAPIVPAVALAAPLAIRRFSMPQAGLGRS